MRPIVTTTAAAVVQKPKKLLVPQEIPEKVGLQSKNSSYRSCLLVLVIVHYLLNDKY